MTPESREILRKWLDQGSDWLKRPRESVSADEVIAKMREIEWLSQHAKVFGETAIQMIELTIAETCNPETKGSA